MDLPLQETNRLDLLYFSDVEFYQNDWKSNIQKNNLLLWVFADYFYQKQELYQKVKMLVINNLQNYLGNLGVADDQYVDSLNDGKSEGCLNEVFVISKLFNIEIIVLTSDGQRIVYGENSSNSIIIGYDFSQFFTLKKDNFNN